MNILNNLKEKYLYIIVFITLYSFICVSNLVYADDLEIENKETNATEEIIEILNTQNVANNLEIQPIINSKNYVIYDRKSKRIIYGKNENTKCMMASTTKIATAIVVLENAKQNEKVIISEKAARTGGSRLGLKKGDTVTVEDLLYGLMLKSGNDAAVALAESVGGSVENFAEMMNKKANELNLNHTHFVTPHGLDNPEHFTTAKELAILTDYALSNPKFKEIVGTLRRIISISDYTIEIRNTNELLGVLDGVVGVKTGFTNGAGRCLVTETVRGDRDLIVVVLGADTKKDRTKDSMKLIEFGFNEFCKIDLESEVSNFFEQWCDMNAKRMTLLKSKENEISLKMSELKTKTVLLQEKDIDKIQYEINSLTVLKAPVAYNTKIGNINIILDDEIIDQVDIIVASDVEKKDWYDYLCGICRLINCKRLLGWR